jgi:hypothetical protein
VGCIVSGEQEGRLDGMRNNSGELFVRPHYTPYYDHSWIVATATAAVAGGK